MVTAIIVAAGKGLRMQADVRKQYLLLEGEPIVARTLRIFDRISAITAVVLVVPPEDMTYCRRLLVEKAPSPRRVPLQLVAGGGTRQESVYHGLCAVAPGGRNGLVAIHDGVRPFVTPTQVEACIARARRTGACILAVPATDTLKQLDPGGHVATTLARDRIWFAQTPQVFRYTVILGAHETAREQGLAATDDAALVEMMGGQVAVCPGGGQNIKITTPEDFTFAALYANACAGT